MDEIHTPCQYFSLLLFNVSGYFVFVLSYHGVVSLAVTAVSHLAFGPFSQHVKACNTYKIGLHCMH